MTHHFDYGNAFSRNIGWVTRHEQAILRERRIAIAGLGGVGGSHLLTLTRLGIGTFHIADPDHFELANFNRQAGASLGSIGEGKVDALARLARDINPELGLETFRDGVTADNLDAFLDGIDLYMDGLDFFAVEARRMVFDACASRDIPAVTAAPLGMGAAVLNFLPGHMNFEEYFRLEGHEEDEQLVRFLVGLSPAMLQRGYLADRSSVDFHARRGPSTAMACDICAGVAATEALKILLKRGRVRAAPHGIHYDAYRNRIAHTWRPGGNRNPLQRLAIAVARRQLAHMRRQEPPAAAKVHATTPVEQVLDLARWAPSGDNSQPWRFEIRGERQILIHARDEVGESVYDYADGQPSWISFGFLLESVRLAATRYGLGVHWNTAASDGHQHIFELDFQPDDAIAEDPLSRHLVSRSVNRRPYRTRRLEGWQKSALQSALGDEFAIVWRETPGERFACARLNARATDIRMNIPEAYSVHRKIIDWTNDYSPDGVPARAVGVDAVTRRIMHFVMGSWRRTRLVNRYLAGTALARLELDLLPGIGCAAHFFILPAAGVAAEMPPRDVALRAGMALQRFWLAADRMGLAVQPSLATLAFAWYAARGVPFTEAPASTRKARRLAARLEALEVADSPGAILFMGRIGQPRRSAGRARSIRRPLEELLIRSDKSQA